MSRLLPGEMPASISKRELESAQAMADEMKRHLDSGPVPLDYDILEHDNRGVSYREPSEPSLRVQREPQEIRPSAHTGVLYNFDQEDVLQLSLENPTVLPEYEIDSVKLSTGHHLCQACLDVLNYYCKYKEIRSAVCVCAFPKTESSSDVFNKWEEAGNTPRTKRFSLSNAVVHHFNIYSLLAFAEIDCCYLCNHLLENLRRGWRNTLTLDKYADYRMEVCFQQSSKMRGKDTIYFIFTNPLLERDTWNFIHVYRMQLWPENTLSHYIEKSLIVENDETHQTLNLTHGSSDAPPAHALASFWLDRCKRNTGGHHEECNKWNSNYLPTRLLDVKKFLTTSSLRLTCPGTEPQAFVNDRKYATLSHCWGNWGASEDPVLKRSNLEIRRERGLELSALPKTFHDAIKIAGWLGSKCLTR